MLRPRPGLQTLESSVADKHAAVSRASVECRAASSRRAPDAPPQTQGSTPSEAGSSAGGQGLLSQQPPFIPIQAGRRLFLLPWSLGTKRTAKGTLSPRCGRVLRGCLKRPPLIPALGGERW